MKTILSGVAALLVSALTAAPVLAQSKVPTGTWNLNLAKSKFVTTSAPKSLTRTAVSAPGGAKVTYQGEASDGAAITYSFMAHYDGKDSPVIGSGMPFGADTVSIKSLNATTTEATLKKGGTVVGKSRATYSADHNTITLALEDASGRPTGDSAVYEKQ